MSSRAAAISHCAFYLCETGGRCSGLNRSEVRRASRVVNAFVTLAIPFSEVGLSLCGVIELLVLVTKKRNGADAGSVRCL